jgi:hypothetical protein
VISRLSLLVLRAGLDDWVPLAAVDGLARQLGASTSDEATGASLAAIRELVENSLAVIGEVSDGGFFEWTGPQEESLARVEEARRALHQNEWGFFCWLQNTPSGDGLAKIEKT